MSAKTEVWVEEYARLRNVQLKLRKFLQSYDMILKQIAVAYNDCPEQECEYCDVQVTTLIDSHGWYFEWTCGGDRYPQGRCTADTSGWYVPMDVVHEELAAALAAAASS